MRTKVEWATHTANDQAGCTRVSKACANCYAAEMSVRLQANFAATGQSGLSRYAEATNGEMRNPQWTGKIVCDLDCRSENFASIRMARRPRRTFYGSMTDIFHESLAISGPELSCLAREVALLRDGCNKPQAVLFLTKRPSVLLRWQQHWFPEGLPPQVWVGVTAEMHQQCVERIPLLLRVKADVRFLSCEPLFEQLDLSPWLGEIHWVIAGGESGFCARPTNPDWFRGLRDQCIEARVPFFFKQWGCWAPLRDLPSRIAKKYTGKFSQKPRFEMLRVAAAKEAGRSLDNRLWTQFPKVDPVKRRTNA